MANTFLDVLLMLAGVTSAIGAPATPVLAAAETANKYQLICNVRGSYAIAFNDAGEADLSGNPLSGSNRTLIEITQGDDNSYVIFISAYINNKLSPQMRRPVTADVEVENRHLNEARATWIAFEPESVVLEKGPSSWRYIHTSTTIISDEIANKVGCGKGGPQIIVDVGNCQMVSPE